MLILEKQLMKEGEEKYSLTAFFAKTNSVTYAGKLI